MKEPQEGIPVSLMEAMASGVPVVATKHGGIHELVKDGETGLLIPEKDADVAAKKLEYLIEHPSSSLRMAENARRFIEQNYNIQKLNKELVKVYEDISKM